MGILNFFFLALCAPGLVGGALSLSWCWCCCRGSSIRRGNFVDLMVIDRDTAAFLFTIFPNLRFGR